MSFKPGYSRFLGGLGEKLHFCAHSHHPWPDCTRDAQLKAWDDAAARADEKWDIVFGEVLPQARSAIASVLRLPNPEAVAFAPNTHEFVVRLLSCLAAKPSILTSDSEFHSFARQTARLEEDGAFVTRVAVEPIETFTERFIQEAKKKTYDMAFHSQVFFNSGLRLTDNELERIAAALDKEVIHVMDGYHAFMAVPVNLTHLSSRSFYLAGGYKYAQAGEGVCFMAMPSNCTLRPRNTGWFSDFAGLEKGISSPVGYGDHGWRFWGSTFDSSGLYRWNAVTDWRRSMNLTVEKSDAHVRGLQRHFLKRLAEKARGPFKTGALISTDLSRLGHFLTFRLTDAPVLSKKLAADHGVLTDARGDRLRFGFGLYHDQADIDGLFSRLDGFA